MKKLLLTILLLSISAYAGQNNYRSVPTDKATLLQEGKDKESCIICGMNLPMFYRTSHAATHEGHDKQYCSIVCVVTDSMVNQAKLTNFRVVDNRTLKLIDSHKAYFVVGSKKPATMSWVSKYAFGNKRAAKKFQKRYGGEIMDFDSLYKFVEKNKSKK